MENDLVKAKKDNLRKLKDKGITPYPYKFSPTAYSSELHAKYASLKNEESGPEFKVAGRVMVQRSFGAIAFIKLMDSKGMIQLFFRKEVSKPEAFELLSMVDAGDFVGATGKVYRTQRGELSILVDSLEMLSKSILPLPEKFHGLQDIETRQRKRYLDLIMNPEVRERFVKRAQITKAIREFLDSKGFLEVEIPVLQPIYGGASARPYVTESNAWKSKFYLSISPELYLKRLIVGGYEKVYTICKNFRNEDVDKTHNPEFTMLEFYAAYMEREDVMALFEQMTESVALKVLGTTKIQYEGKEIDLKAPWPRLTMLDALKKYANIDVAKMNEDEMLALCRKEGIELSEDEQKHGLIIAALFEHFCEPFLVQPVFITEHPRETTPLCKLSRNNPSLVERCEAYINSWEIGNGYSELNDPILQRQLFEEQKDQGRAKGENHPIDEDFLEAIGYGMPPTGGLGFGVDRIVMLLTGAPTIRDIIFFPQMRPEKEAQK